MASSHAAGRTLLIQVTRRQRCRRRPFSSTTPTSRWWNPFAEAGVRDTNPRVSSAKSTGTSNDDNPRIILERKDATLAILALEFRRLALASTSTADLVDRETIVDLAFESIKEKELDSKSMLQLRHELQNCLQEQVVNLFQAFAAVDQSFGDPDRDDDTELQALSENVLRAELERTIDELAAPRPLRSEKGANPTEFLQLKRSAIETLLERRHQYGASDPPASSTDTTGSDEKRAKGDTDVTWNDADAFGYHETIDMDRNALIRHYQTVNLCRSAKLRDDWGFSVIALQSSIASAGRGVFIDGFAKAGSIVAFQPGKVWSKEYLVNLPVEVERDLEKNDSYQMSLRADDYMIDSRKSPYTVLTGNNSNPFALGHVINHPTPTKPPNCRSVMVNFTKSMDLGDLQRYIPNEYARPRTLTLTGGLWDQGEVVDMHGLCLVLTRDVCNEELFYDYRLMTPHLPSWYHRFQDNSFEEDS